MIAQSRGHIWCGHFPNSEIGGTGLPDSSTPGRENWLSHQYSASHWMIMLKFGTMVRYGSRAAQL